MYDIVLLSLNPYPIGNVATVRYSSYCHSLAATGRRVKIYVIAPSRTARLNEKPFGMYKNVAYQYMTGVVTWGSDARYINKIYHYFVGTVNSCRQLIIERPRCVIYYGGDLFTTLILKVFSKYISAKLVTDRSEYPEYVTNGRWLGKFVENCRINLFDIVVVMTKELDRFYGDICGKGTKTYLLPMTIDSERFVEINIPKPRNSYIGCTFGVHGRDCIEDTISAYFSYRESNPNGAFVLKLAGDKDGLPNVARIQELMLSSIYSDGVIFVGVLDSIEVVDFLCNASCLITTSRGYASGGFPTKLGEYLATGVPVVVTQVGEIGEYLINGINAFMCEPCDIVSIGQALSNVENNYDLACQVGSKGRDVALTAFNADTYADELSSVLLD